MLLKSAGSKFRGRVMGVRMLAIYGLPIGLLLAGLTIPLIGFQATASAYCLVGLACMVLIGIWVSGRDLAEARTRLGTSDKSACAVRARCQTTRPRDRKRISAQRSHRLARRFPTGTEGTARRLAATADRRFPRASGPVRVRKIDVAAIDRRPGDQPDSGTLRWDGEMPPPGDIGYVFQDATLLPWASAEDNVWLPLRLRGIAREAARADIAAALARVGLTGFETARPAQLSGGMRMRVSIARALVTRPKLLLMDEPFAALDEFTRHRLQDDLLTMWRDIGCTVVFVTHSIYEAAFLARRIVLMTPRPGRIANEMTARPIEGRLDPAYAALVAAVSAAMAAALESV